MKKQSVSEIFVALVLIVTAVLFRVVIGELQNINGAQSFPEWLPNFSPLAALVLCGAIFLPPRVGVALPLGILFLSDVILNWFYKAPLLESSMIVRYLALGALALGGLWLRKNPRPRRVLTGSFAGSVFFYITTNTGSWLTLGYAKNFGGWLQAITTGLPDVNPPAWIFFRNSLASDLLFTGAILICVALVREKENEPQPVAAH